MKSMILRRIKGLMFILLTVVGLLLFSSSLQHPPSDSPLQIESVRVFQPLSDSVGVGCPPRKGVSQWRFFGVEVVVSDVDTTAEIYLTTYCAFKQDSTFSLLWIANIEKLRDSIRLGIRQFEYNYQTLILSGDTIQFLIYLPNCDEVERLRVEALDRRGNYAPVKRLVLKK
jgi:hypothetical protein